MKVLAFIITYILPPILAGILAQKFGKPIQKFLERLFNNKHDA
jgi:hypothetical protein